MVIYYTRFPDMYRKCRFPIHVRRTCIEIGYFLCTFWGPAFPLRFGRAGIGASYDRIRSDTVLAGQGASSILRSTYLGEGDQIHDLRTKQDHVASKTISDLLCKGAVTGSSRSIYSGLIKMRHGAVRSNAMQTNHNLVLSEAAHADSVPNLDISENDVRCSHASTVGPIDEDQRYYLESRGIEPAEAERLLVRGFFRDLLNQTTQAGVVDLVAAEIESRLDALELS